jgi:hypothetical protein
MEGVKVASGVKVVVAVGSSVGASGVGVIAWYGRLQARADRAKASITAVLFI